MFNRAQFEPGSLHRTRVTIRVWVEGKGEFLINPGSLVMVDHIKEPQVKHPPSRSGVATWFIQTWPHRRLGTYLAWPEVFLKPISPLEQLAAAAAEDNLT